MLLDIGAPIIPAKGLGGIALGSELVDLGEILNGLGLWRAGKYAMASLYEAEYRLDDECVAIYVDVRRGKVFRLTALVGYQGALLDTIRPGMLIGEVLSAHPEFAYDEGEEVVLSRVEPGVALATNESDPAVSKVHQLPISGISVFLPGIDSADFQRGNW